MLPHGLRCQPLGFFNFIMAIYIEKTSSPSLIQVYHDNLHWEFEIFILDLDAVHTIFCEDTQFGH